jgi:hypothetical protein
MQEQQRQRYYFGALSLNNSAVVLLERGRNCQALAVLQDAMFAMREVTQHRSSNPPIDDPTAPAASRPSAPTLGRMTDAAHREATLAEMLRVASRLVMDSASAPVPPPSAYPGVRISTHVLDVDMPELSTRDRGLPSVTDVTLIRIEATQCRDFDTFPKELQDNDNEEDDDEDDEDEDDDGPQLESIAILHNFAAASRLHPLVEQDLRRRAVTVTHLAYCLSCRFLQGGGGGGPSVAPAIAPPGIGPFLEQAMLRISLLLIRCNYQLCVDLGDCDAAWRSLHQYRTFQTALEAEEGQLANMMDRISVPHAKAA